MPGASDQRARRIRRAICPCGVTPRVVCCVLRRPGRLAWSSHQANRFLWLTACAGRRSTRRIELTCPTEIPGIASFSSSLCGYIRRLRKWENSPAKSVRPQPEVVPRVVKNSIKHTTHLSYFDRNGIMSVRRAENFKVFSP